MNEHSERPWGGAEVNNRDVEPQEAQGNAIREEVHPASSAEQRGSAGGLSTADIAAERHGGSEQVPATTRANADQGQTPLFPESDAQTFCSRWDKIQASFVDDPRNSVQQADTLVAEVMQRLAQTFSTERGELEGEWERGNDVSTEELRVALQRYRSFFGRLLSV